MALNIKDDETDRLVRELAAETGQSITEAVRDAVRSQLEIARRRKVGIDVTELEAVIARGRSRPMLDARNTEEILGYDHDGLPS